MCHQLAEHMGHGQPMERPYWWALCLTCRSLSGSLIPLYHLSDRCVVTFSIEKAGVFVEHWKLLLLSQLCSLFAPGDIYSEVVPCGRVRNELVR